MPVVDDSINLPSGSELWTGSRVPPTPALTFALADTAVVNVAVSGSIANTSTVASGPWSIAAIAGLTITPSSGGAIAPGATVTLSLTATAAGTYSPGPVLTCDGATIAGNPQGLVVTPAPSIVLSSSGAATVGVEHTVTVTAANLTGPLTVTPVNVSGTATFNPTTATPAPGELVKLFGATWAAAGTHQIRATAPGGLVSNTISVVVSNPPPAGPTTATLSVPANGTNDVAATVTITLNAAAGVGGRSFTLSASSGTLGSTTVNIAQGATSGTTTITRSSSGTSTITMTGGGGLTLLGTPATFSSSAASSSTPFRVVRTNTRYATLAQAVAGAISGDTITVSPGTYTVLAGPGEDPQPGQTYTGSGGINLHTLTIEWEVPGARPVLDLSQWAQAAGFGGQPKGLHAGSSNRNFTVRGLELIGSKNGSSYGIYSEGGYPSGNPVVNLTIEDCKLKFWADGVKTTYANRNMNVTMRRTTVEDCSGDSLTHGIYVQGDFLDVLGCTFRTTVAGNPTGAEFLGHLLKSRMARTRVRGSLFDMRGGGASCIEAPNGGDLEVYGNIILKFNVGNPSNPPIKYGFEENVPYINVTLTGSPITVGSTITGANGATGIVVKVTNSDTRLYFTPTSGGTRFDVGGQNILVAGVVRAVQVGSSGGSPDGVGYATTHRVRVAQNTVRNEQPSSWGGTTATAIGMLWVSNTMTDADANAISNQSIVDAGFVRNNIVADIGTGNRTVANIAPEPQYADNSPVEAITVSTSGTLGVYSGTAIAGSPANNDAAYQYAGEYTEPLARTDTFRGGRIEGLPAWRTAMTVPLRWQALTPTATIASLDPRLDGALNPNGAGNTPPWHNASNPQAQIFNAWGGGAYNRASKKLIAHGGGHLGYEGNELYAINMSAAAPTWTRLCPPSGSIPRPATFSGGKAVAGSNAEVCTDERPRAVHVYGIGAQDNAGRYFQMPGGSPDSIAGGIFTARAFRFVGDDWNLTSSPETLRYYSGPGASVYDPTENVIWHVWGATTFKFNPETLAVISRTNHDGALYYGNAVIGSGHVLAMNAGGSGSNFLRLFVFQTSAPGTWGLHYNGTGGTFAISGTPPPYDAARYYSIAWDSIRGRLLVYNGGTRMFTLTPPGSGSWITGTWTWGELTCSTASYSPPTDSGNGIFGRFFFDADYNCAVCQPSDVTAPLIVLPLEA